MKEISRRVQKLEVATKTVLSSTAELIDFIQRAQRGEVNIRSAEISAELLNGRRNDRARAERQINELMEEYKMSREEAIELAKIHAPTLASWLM